MSLSHRRRTARSAGLLAIVLVSGLVGVPPARAVTGGTPASDGSAAFAARIDVGPGQRACSGALVDPWWVLTAKSCFSIDGQPVVEGRPATPSTVTVGRTDLTTSAGLVASVFRIVPHPDRDVVLARLSRRADVPPVPLGATPQLGEQLTVAGFGRTADTWVPDRLHTGAFSVQGVTASTLAITGNGQAAICRGDLGGPAYRLSNGQPQLVALHRTSWQGGCLGETETRRDAVETRVDDLGSWLSATIPQGPATDRFVDVNFLYTYASGNVAPNTLPATSSGGFTAPIGEWAGGNGAYAADRVKVLNDDFDGDGVNDVAVMSTRTDGSFAIDTFITRPDGRYSAPIRSWTYGSAFGHLGSMKMVSGDWNGDGRADLAAFYGYAGGTGLEAWIHWYARPDGGFGDPTDGWRGPEWGNWAKAKVVSGDFNGDGRDDVAAFQEFDTRAMSVSTWLAKADGTLAAPFQSWFRPKESPFGWLASMKLAHGDFNGDSRGDIGVLYGYADGRLSTFTWTAKADGTFNEPVSSWLSSTFGPFARIKLLSGDHNGDKRDDLSFLYQEPDDAISTHTLTSTTQGTFNAPVKSWYAARNTYGWWPNMKTDGE
ncbi:trypsin-like serine protease [Micromonospora sp. WMMD1120]|uniref:trypsin-like serine protease n=1 Tax=Micromonospora sp. WMMD1120 TaxID=3016106 RepID=UPI002416247E|nr:trypsin-like serine protease [Micromonospora sp. WMMD1120]MDG4808997.1 trypsin-like serine protease [Micromonospora sp. WMMD1120]